MEIASFIVSFATLIISVFVSAISPIIIEKIKARRERKTWNRDFYEKHRCEVIENYLKAVGEYIFYPSGTNESKFGCAVSEIFMYAPEDSWGVIQKMNEAIANYKGTDRGYLKIQYFELCKLLAPLKREKDNT